MDKDNDTMPINNLVKLILEHPECKMFLVHYHKVFFNQYCDRNNELSDF